MIDHFNWRSIFYVAVPVSALGDADGQHVPAGARGGRAPRARFDWPGFVLLGDGARLPADGALQRPARRLALRLHPRPVRRRGRSTAVAFFVWELRAPQPLVNLRVLAQRAVHLRGHASPSSSASGLFGSTYLVPLFVQTVQHLTPLAAGLLLMPGGLILGLFMPIGGYLSDRIPARKLIIAGLAVLRRLRLSGSRTSTSTAVLDHRVVRGAVAHRARASSSPRSTSPRCGAAARSCSGRAPA